MERASGEAAIGGVRWRALLFVGLSLSIGWGIRGNYGHEWGAALPGCGFQPVYRAASGEGPGPSADLAAVEVRPMFERPGQILRETLKARLASDSGVPHRYDLLVSFTPGGFEELFVKYSTAGLEPSASEGFMEEATDRFGSHFEHA